MAKRTRIFSSFLHTILPARCSVLYHILFSDGKEVMLFASLIMMLCLRTVMYCADTQSDVMFAHYAVRRNITYAVNIIAEGFITCPQGQTSFG